MKENSLKKALNNLAEEFNEYFRNNNVDKEFISPPIVTYDGMAHLAKEMRLKEHINRKLFDLYCIINCLKETSYE